MAHYIIYHNTRCSKSRGTHALLEEAGVDFDERFYLEKPPTVEELRKIVNMLGVPAINIVRTAEDVWRESGLSKNASDDDILAFLASHPQALERPIVVKDETSAIIGRPPENVKKLF